MDENCKLSSTCISNENSKKVSQFVQGEQLYEENGLLDFFLKLVLKQIIYFLNDIVCLEKTASIV